MSSVSRGLAGFLYQHYLRLPSSLRSTLFRSREPFFRPNIAQNSRPFSSSIWHRYRQQGGLRPNVFINGDPVLRQVTQTRQPVLLYKAPKTGWYYFKVYGSAGLWFGTGIYAIKFQDDIKDYGLPEFVRPVYVFVGLSFIAIGCYTCTAPTNRMRALEVIPSLQGGPMQLRMTVRAAPFLRDKVLYANLGGVTISEKTYPMKEEFIEAERARNQDLWDGLEKVSMLSRLWEFSERWVYQKWTNFFLSFKFAVLRFGIAKVEVQGQKWKIDCSGWLLEDGKAIDRLIEEV